MILVDTSVWIDHFRFSNHKLLGLLESESVVIHPFVVGELALGNLTPRDKTLEELQKLPHIGVATPQEVLSWIEQGHLSGRGVGYLDAHLLAAVRLTAGTSFWTFDKRLNELTAALGLSYAP